MKIVTYNVNGLRPRVSQFGSLKKLLDSLDADIICLQETKLSRNELRADLVRAEGYESFFSCTRTSEKGRTGYSGVATFCRVKSAFSSNEVALPVSAEEGFTGVLENSPRYGAPANESQSVVIKLNDFTYDELLKIDGEGRCIVTDHGHFVLFNLYGPRAHDDMERVDFKRKFYSILQKRWESLLVQGKRVFVVGDLNIAPTAMDRCDAGPDFEKNEFRMWFRSLLKKNGGPFVDVFRENHRERNQAFTCWSTNSGAEMFNYGSRIDHMLVAGSCLHEEEQGHSLLACHVKGCDVLEQFKRWKSGNIPRWKSGKNIKLEGSDHIPVYMSLIEIPDIHAHSTPSLSTRYSPQVYGFQQTLVSMFTRRQPDEENLSIECSSVSEESIIVKSSCGFMKRSLSASSPSSPGKTNDGLFSTQIVSVVGKKKAKRSQSSQLSLNSFFQKTPRATGDSNICHSEKKLNQECISSLYEVVGEGCETDTEECHLASLMENDGCQSSQKEKKNSGCVSENNMDQQQISSPNEERHLASPLENEASQSSEKEKKSSAFTEWQRIQQLMQTSTPLCKGHKEPCVSRVVKKSGPNLGRRFYVCARAEGPSSNPEANCDFFKWANSKSKPKG